MLLIAGGDTDPQLKRLIERAQERKIPHHALLHSDGGAVILEWSLESDQLRINHQLVKPTAAFVRQDVFRYLANKQPMAHTDARSWKVMLDGWLWSHPKVKIFNRHFAMKDAVNKPLALIWAKEAGLEIPATTLHSSVAAAAHALTKEAVVYKPVAGGDNCRELNQQALDKVATEWLPRPYIFQEKLVPPEIRIFRVGDKFFSFQIDADALDYRTAGGDATITAVETPTHLIDGLTKITERIGLSFAAADFKTSPHTSQLIFLEVNSNPMFSAFDTVCNGELSFAMLDYLSSGR